MKKLFSLLLVLALCLSLFPAAFAEEPVGADVPVSPEETTPPSAQGADTSPYTGEAETDPDAPVGDGVLDVPEEDPSTSPDGSAQDDTGDDPAALAEREPVDPSPAEEPVNIETPKEPSEAEPDALPSVGEINASSGQCGNYLSWSFDYNTGKLTIKGSGAMYDWSSQSEVPWWAWHKEITSVSLPSGLTTIGSNAFSSCTKLSSITIPINVSVIGAYSFYGSGITAISIPSGVTTIPDYAFSDCDSLKTVSLPNTLTSIGNSAFRDCDLLTTVTIPESVTSIGNMAFCYDYSLKGIVIPANVSEIGTRAFSSCWMLTEIVVAENNPSYVSIFSTTKS